MLAPASFMMGRWLVSAGRPIGLLCASLLIAATSFATPTNSTCHGTPSRGRLENGVRLPLSGPNYTSYSTVAAHAGRTYVHSTVHDIVVAAYESLQVSHAGKVYVYAETGFAEGGPFKPHRTHQNGLSVDFMVPVLRGTRSVPLPTHAWNRYGYDIEFDAKGRYDDYVIDFEALGAHLVALHKAAQARKVGIARVIFDPPLQPALLATSHGDYLRRHLRLPKTHAWVRHDEHYHVDFDVPCRP